MIALIEKSLAKKRSHIIDYATLKNILINLGYLGIKDKINKLKEKGIIKTLKRELFVHTSQFTNNIISKEIISNNILGPSYISLDYALYHHNLIPEKVYEITAITTKRSKNFNTEYGLFSYKQMRKDLFPVGLKIEFSINGNFLIASKEKALCDKLYFSKSIKISSLKIMMEYLENDLRIDFDELNDLDIDILREYYKKTRSKKIGLLIKVFEK